MSLKSKTEEAKNKNKTLEFLIEREKTKAEQIHAKAVADERKITEQPSIWQNKWLWIGVVGLTVVSLGVYLYKQNENLQ